MQRKASAVWQGDLKRGQGSLSTESGVLNKAQYSFSTRLGLGKKKCVETRFELR